MNACGDYQRNLQKNKILIGIPELTRIRKDNIKEEDWIICRGTDLKVILSMFAQVTERDLGKGVGEWGLKL